MYKKILLLILTVLSIFIFSNCTKSEKPQSEAPQDEAVKEEVVSQFSTKILDKTEGRMINLKLGAARINGVTVEPNATFSFNDTVGKASEENGFKHAVTLDGKGNKVIDDGGGICQISTTLFNATKKAGMSIVERHPHTKSVGYVKRGQDAAIDFESMDFKFTNTKNYPIRIKAEVSQKKVSIYLIKNNI